MHYPKASRLGSAVSVIAITIVAICAKIIDEDNHSAVNFIAGVIALIAAGAAIGGFFQRHSDFSVAVNAFRIFTMLLVPYCFLLAVIYGEQDSAAEFLSFIEEVFFTGQLITKHGSPVASLTMSLSAVVVVTTGYYGVEDEVQWPITMFCFWVIIISMTTLGIVL